MLSFSPYKFYPIRRQRIIHLMLADDGNETLLQHNRPTFQVNRSHPRFNLLVRRIRVIGFYLAYSVILESEGDFKAFMKKSDLGPNEENDKKCLWLNPMEGGPTSP
jgi:hypothetical protein